MFTRFLILLLFASASTFAQFPTAKSLTIAVSTNGTLLTPTNFFQANSNLVATSIAGTTIPGPLNVASNRILNLGTPLLGTDAATKAYVDTTVGANAPIIDSRANILLNPAINSIVDTNSSAINISLLGAGGSLPNRVGSATHTIAGTTASGVVMARRTYYVSGSTGTVTYNAVAYSPGQTFVGVYGTKTFVATGDCIVRDNTSRQADSAYTAGLSYVSTIGGGYDHLANGTASTIAGGGHNELRSASSHATISGGSYNVSKAGQYSFIGGGTQNQQSQDFGVIGGGWGNWVTSDNVAAADGSAIVSGDENQIQDVAYGFIGTGLNNRIINPNNTGGIQYNAILAGTGNTISGGIHNIGSGVANTIQGDSGGYNWTHGNGNNLAGTTTYVWSYGSANAVTNATRLLQAGASDVINSVTGGAVIGDNISATSMSYPFLVGNAHSGNATAYTIMLGRAITSANNASPAATADYATGLGYGTALRSFGQVSQSAGKLNTTIEAQRSQYIASRRYAHVTGLLSTDVRLNGVDQYVLVPTNSIWMVHATVVAALSDGTKYGVWTEDFAVRDSAGTLSVLGAPSPVVVHNGHSTTWTVAAGIRSSPRGITMNVTALNGETVDWVCTFDTAELSNGW